MIKYLPTDEYKAMWEDCMTRACITNHNLCPSLKYMTVVGQSGEGTSFANEYERMQHKHFNPPMPREINRYEADGLVTYRPEKN